MATKKRKPDAKALFTVTPDVLTHDAPGVDRRWKQCKCGKCGITRQCTPTFDFYNAGKNGPLYCLKCLQEVTNAPDVVIVPHEPETQA